MRIKEGDIVNHFKNKRYKIMAIAKHSEDLSEYVVYQALYEPYGVWVRPLEMFLSKVDSEKYPDVKQTYRFEKIDI